MKLHITVLSLFVVLTLGMTYPLVLHMHEAVQEPGDSLFNAWAVYHDIKALLSRPLNIFDAGIFYPHRYTLAYSEHLIGIGILGIPLYLFIKNPLFIYNFMLLLSFILCGWGVYLLAYYLIKDRLSGIVSGIIAAFCAYRFEQFGHLHILTSQWIPFALLCLHKGISGNSRREKVKYAALFGAFFFFQCLSSGHNGLYLALASGMFLIYFRKDAGWMPWAALFAACLFLIPFYYPYFYLAKVFGFVRPASEFRLYSPQVSSYLAVPAGNWIYGKYLSRFCRPEAVMFPGAAAVALVFLRVIPRFSLRFKKNALNMFILADIAVILFVAVTGGIDLGRAVLGVKLKITDFTRPVYILLALVFVKLYKAGIIRKITAGRGIVQFYWILGITAFILSFGPVIRAGDKDIMWGPYSLLYDFVPGFKGIRVSGRIYVLFILSLAVLAGYGVKRIRGMKAGYYLSWIIPFIAAAECVNTPIGLKCRIGADPPSAVYKWLATQPAGGVVLELPMPGWYSMFWHEIEYQYFSLYHNMKLINGYSGYSPPAYWPVAEKMKNFPDRNTLEILRYLRVKYIIVHEDVIRDWGWPSVTEKIKAYKGIFKLRAHDNVNYIYEFTGRRKNVSERKLEGGPLLEKGWTLSANYNPQDIGMAADGDIETRWHTKAGQVPGMKVELDMKRIRRICGISMYFGRYYMDYPRGLRIEVSEDGADWREPKTGFIYADYVKHLIRYPMDRRMRICFPPIDARYIRLTQTGSHDVFFWSICELNVWGKRERK